MSRLTKPSATSPELIGATARDGLFEQHKALAAAIAGRIAQEGCSPLPLEEAVAQGLRGLADAAVLYQPHVHGSFSLFAKSAVRAAILDSVRKNSHAASDAPLGRVAA